LCAPFSIAYINPTSTKKRGIGRKEERKRTHTEKQATRGKRQQEERRETKRIDRD
jgi:hypothetical protein